MSRQIQVANVKIGGGAPVSIQSMCNTNTADVKATVSQINALAEAGCQIVRLAVPDAESAAALPAIIDKSSVPLIADIHFDWRLAMASIKAGIHGLRINPGNIGDATRVKEVVKAAQAKAIPIRIGVNGGSLEKQLLAKYGVSPQALVESALGHVKILEELDFFDIKISVKTSHVKETIMAYQLLAQRCDYPLHIGVTEAGTAFSGTIKSAIGIGSLLAMGIGDTIRVSLTADPIEEVRVAKEILKALGLRRELEIISCPTCGRTKIDLIKLAIESEKRLEKYRHLPISVAVMGCVVNGPGEAREADYGIAGGCGEGLIFKKGEIIKKVPEEKLIDELIRIMDTDLTL